MIAVVVCVLYALVSSIASANGNGELACATTRHTVLTVTATDTSQICDVILEFQCDAPPSHQILTEQQQCSSQVYPGSLHFDAQRCYGFGNGQPKLRRNITATVVGADGMCHFEGRTTFQCGDRLVHDSSFDGYTQCADPQPDDLAVYNNFPERSDETATKMRGYDEDGPTRGYGEDSATHGYAEDGPTHGYAEDGPTHDYAEDGPTHDYAEDGPTHGYAEDGPTHGYAEDGPTRSTKSRDGGIAPNGILLGAILLIPLYCSVGLNLHN